MKLRSVYAPKLILTAQAQFLRIMTRVAEQFSQLDLSDTATVADVFSRLAAYVRGFSEEAVPVDEAPKFAAAKRTTDDIGTDDQAELTAIFRRAFQDSNPADESEFTLAVSTLLVDFQDEPQDVLSRIAEYLRSFADEVAEPADALLGFAVAKLLTDIPAPADAAPMFAVQKALNDAAQMLDQLRLSPRLGQYETLIASDARKLTTGKFFAETSKPLDLARLTPLVRFADLQDGQTDEVTLSAGLKIEESGQYVEGYGDYADEDYFLKTPQLTETAFLLSVNKALEEGAAAADALALALTTLLADTVDEPLDAAKLTPLLGLLESQGLIESLLFNAGKALTDLAAFTETAKLTAAKRLTDTQAVTDVLTRVATQYRALTDSFGTTEALIRTMAKPLADSATPADAPKKHLSLKLLEGGEYAESGYFEADDYVVGGVAIGDSLTIV